MTRYAEGPRSLQDPDETVERITRFLQTHTERVGARYLVVGMSGGLDSSVTAAICSKAVGGKRTLGFCLPEKETRNERAIKDAENVARKFQVKLKLLDITDLVQCAKSLLQPRGQMKPVSFGNLKARLRATILYYQANSNNGLVIGTGDKSELMLGYFTKYGDGASDIQPIADLYKTTVRDLAKHLAIPSRVYSKPSSPELWPGQTAEDELGLDFERLDLILWGLERWLAPQEISAELDLPIGTVRKVQRRWMMSEHKRRMPLTMKLGFRTPGQDMRVPNDL